jgi:branched-chain amino acid transport system permease protein
VAWTATRIRACVTLGSLALFIASFFLDGYTQYIVNLVLIYVILGLGLNLLLGYAGQFAFVHAALMGIGAYIATLLPTKMDVSFWIALPLAGIVAAIFGAVIALPAIRISRVYLALLTLGVAQLATWVLINWQSVTGGTDGVSLAAPYVFNHQLSGDHGSFLVIFPIMIFMYWLARKTLDGKLGRAFIAIRENEIVAQCNGIDVTRTKIIVFALAGFYAGIGGGLYALTLGFIVPESFGLQQVVLQFSVAVLGGLMSLPGMVLGSILVTTLPEILRDVQAWQEIIYGLILMLVILFMPSGVSGLFKRWSLLPQEVLARKWRRLEKPANNRLAAGLEKGAPQ